MHVTKCNTVQVVTRVSPKTYLGEHKEILLRSYVVASKNKDTGFYRKICGLFVVFFVQDNILLE